MKFLITGGCGFIGTSLIKALVDTPGQHHIRVIDNLSVGTRQDLDRVCSFREINPVHAAAHSPDGVELLMGDILDDALAAGIMTGIDTIVHLAANTGVGPSVEDPRADCMANVIGTLNYLESARINNVQRFVFASSGAPAGEVEPPIHEELPPHPASPYGASKLAGEGYCSAYKKSFGIDTVALRFGNVYGPGSLHKSSVVAKFIKSALEGRPMEIFGDGTQTRDFIFIDDLVQAVLLASRVPDIGGEVFQIATNAETTVAELSEMIKQVLIRQGFENVSVTYGRPRPPGDVKRNFSDTSKAARLLGWQAQNDLKKGLEQTVSYFLQQ
jgi:UDP-glucose 4-epimerase